MVRTPGYYDDPESWQAYGRRATNSESEPEECPMCGGEGIIDLDTDPDGEGRRCPRCFGNQ